MQYDSGTIHLFNHLINVRKNMQAHDILIRKLQEHSSLSKADIAAICSLPTQQRTLTPNADIVRQGDKPTVSVIVLGGMVARYHALKEGKRQYLSFHIAGDMPDAQALFIETMDHAVCTVDKAIIATVPHEALLEVFKDKPNVGFSIWRETLIDAAIFREAITNNSARSLESRIAHFFCEQYYRADKNGLVALNTCRLPLTQTQLAETLASSLPSISRTLIKLRKTKAVEFRNGDLTIKNWDCLSKIGEFNPGYMHLKKPKK
jgi:CRP-like cAMP-binding protein